MLVSIVQQTESVMLLYMRLSVCVCMLSSVRLPVIPWTVAHQATLSVGFPRQEYWSGVPFPTTGDLPDPPIEPCLLHWQADSLPAEP